MHNNKSYSIIEYFGIYIYESYTVLFASLKFIEKFYTQNSPEYYYVHYV